MKSVILLLQVQISQINCIPRVYCQGVITNIYYIELQQICFHNGVSNCTKSYFPRLIDYKVKVTESQVFWYFHDSTRALALEGRSQKASLGVFKYFGLWSQWNIGVFGLISHSRRTLYWLFPMGGVCSFPFYKLFRSN